MIGGNYVPPPLPVGLQRLIDGKTLMSIRVEYTPSGAHVLAVLPGGETQPLHEFRLARERQTRARELRELTTLFAGRVRDRKIEGVVVPPFQSLQEKETWLGALSADNRKLVEMTNKQFRALKGKDAAAEDAAE
jgi:cobalamin biosynthesis Mg chelatase CobN